ncbi:MAG: M20/M25/M40 family metallo-hydrolase [Chloroflexi bacterium]|nr:M20/M25/M40 family metallo-hydrolase [Chloroflexota bacterium]
MRRILHDLEFLTSPQTAGRLSGTAGARRTAHYLKAELDSLGFDSALQPVDVPAARLISTPKLVVGPRAFSPRRDFAELTALSAGGQVKGQLLVVREDDLLPPEDFKGKVILIPERPQGFNLAETLNAAIELGAAALLVEHGEPRWFHKTVYSGSGKIPVLRVRASIAEELAQQNGVLVELDLPLERATRPCNNVIGVLRGDSDFTLALTAHYDHLGDDSDDVRFPGAFDNASGVAAVLSAARELVEEKLPFNLLVAFLTGEESGLWGAKQLIVHPPMPISAVINLDGIGSESKLNALRLGHRQRGDPLAELAENILLKRGIEPKWIGGSDDSSAFISKGIPTLGLGQQPTGQARSVMHTPLDTRESLHLETIHQGVEVLVEIVKSVSMADPKGLQRPLGSLKIHDKEKYHVHAK